MTRKAQEKLGPEKEKATEKHKTGLGWKRRNQNKDRFIVDSAETRLVKNLPAMQETRVRSLGQEDPLEKEMATHTSTLAWRIPRTEEPGGLEYRGLQRVRHDCATMFSSVLLKLM